MNSALVTSLPPSVEERHFTLAQKHVVVQSEAKVTPSGPEKQCPGDQLIIENQYCLRRGQELVKVTFIRIGGEVITLTDRLRLAQDASEEEEKTKSSSTSTTNSPLELHPSSRSKTRKNYLSNNAKEILSLFEKWLHRHHSQNGLMLAQIKEIYRSELQLFHAISANQQLRELFLQFSKHETCRLRRNSNKMLQKWVRECRLVEDQFKKEENYLAKIFQD